MPSYGTIERKIVSSVVFCFVEFYNASILYNYGNYMLLRRERGQSYMPKISTPGCWF